MEIHLRAAGLLIMYDFLVDTKREKVKPSENLYLSIPLTLDNKNFSNGRLEVPLYHQ